MSELVLRKLRSGARAAYNQWGALLKEYTDTRNMPGNDVVRFDEVFSAPNYEWPTNVPEARIKFHDTVGVLLQAYQDDATKHAFHHFGDCTLYDWFLKDIPCILWYEDTHAGRIAALTKTRHGKKKWKCVVHYEFRDKSRYAILTSVSFNSRIGDGAEAARRRCALFNDHLHWAGYHLRKEAWGQP